MTELPERHETLLWFRDSGATDSRFQLVQISRSDFSGDPFHAYGELREQIIPHRPDAAGKPTLFQSLLYRIDLDERKFRRQLQAPDSGTHLADLILNRNFKGPDPPLLSDKDESAD